MVDSASESEYDAFTMAPGLYIHIPFCINKCRYCDFYSITDLSAREPFCAALKQEMGLVDPFPTPFDTLYMGGGTPSILDSGQLSGILEAACRHFPVATGSEITLEANPGTLSLKKCRDYRSMGINRLQIGVQSFQNSHLKFMGRIHSSDDAARAIQHARHAGFSNIGMDLIYGLPGQTRADLLADLQRAVSFEPEHLSCYMLGCEPGTPLDDARNRGEFRMAPEDDVADHYLSVVEFLEAHGYDQYEISNFARRHPVDPGYWRSGHNQKYWRSDPWLGLGPSAHSYDLPVRRWNHRHLEPYLESVLSGRAPVAGSEILTPEQQMMEAIYLGLRTTDGISISEFEHRFQHRLKPVIDIVLTYPAMKNRVLWDGVRFRLKREGMLVMDAMAGLIIDNLTGL